MVSCYKILCCTAKRQSQLKRKPVMACMVSCTDTAEDIPQYYRILMSLLQSRTITGESTKQRKIYSYYQVFLANMNKKMNLFQSKLPQLHMSENCPQSGSPLLRSLDRYHTCLSLRILCSVLYAHAIQVLSRRLLMKIILSGYCHPWVPWALLFSCYQARFAIMKPLCLFSTP